ncbi:MAG: hypothetical protein HYX73_02380 [Acidobacteria bacterium]|nr:hypothetical protein [Acidobacteriota bacterium]
MLSHSRTSLDRNRWQPSHVIFTARTRTAPAAAPGIGASAGAGAGTAVVLSTRGDAAEIGSETPLTFELQSPVTVAGKR